jgi:hypothetical protein
MFGKTLKLELNYKNKDKNYEKTAKLPPKITVFRLFEGQNDRKMSLIKKKYIICNNNIDKNIGIIYNSNIKTNKTNVSKFCLCLVKHKQNHNTQSKRRNLKDEKKKSCSRSDVGYECYDGVWYISSC